MQLSHDESVFFASANGSRGASRYGIAVAYFVEFFFPDVQTGCAGSAWLWVGYREGHARRERGEGNEAVSPKPPAKVSQQRVQRETLENKERATRQPS